MKIKKSLIAIIKNGDASLRIDGADARAAWSVAISRGTARSRGKADISFLSLAVAKNPNIKIRVQAWEKQDANKNELQREAMLTIGNLWKLQHDFKFDDEFKPADAVAIQKFRDSVLNWVTGEKTSKGLSAESVLAGLKL